MTCRPSSAVLRRLISSMFMGEQQRNGISVAPGGRQAPDGRRPLCMTMTEIVIAGRREQKRPRCGLHPPVPVLPRRLRPRICASRVNRARRSGSAAKASGRIFSATWRLSCVSVACQTWPMPPSPRSEVTLEWPRRVPTFKAMSRGATCFRRRVLLQGCLSCCSSLRGTQTRT